MFSAEITVPWHTGRYRNQGGLDDLCGSKQNGVHGPPVMICLLVLIVIFVALMVLSDRLSANNADKVTKPLKQFIGRLEKLSEGDHSSDTDFAVRREMAEMDKAMRTAVVNLNNIIADIREKLHAVQGRFQVRHGRGPGYLCRRLPRHW